MSIVFINENIVCDSQYLITSRIYVAVSRTKNCILFLSAPIPMLGGAKEKFDIGYCCGTKGRVSESVLMNGSQKEFRVLRRLSPKGKPMIVGGCCHSSRRLRCFSNSKLRGSRVVELRAFAFRFEEGGDLGKTTSGGEP